MAHPYMQPLKYNNFYDCSSKFMTKDKIIDASVNVVQQQVTEVKMSSCLVKCQLCGYTVARALDIQ